MYGMSYFWQNQKAHHTLPHYILYMRIPPGTRCVQTAGWQWLTWFCRKYVIPYMFSGQFWGADSNATVCFARSGFWKPQFWNPNSKHKPRLSVKQKWPNFWYKNDNLTIFFLFLIGISCPIIFIRLFWHLVAWYIWKIFFWIFLRK